MKVCGYCGAAVRVNSFGNAIAHSQGYIGRSEEHETGMCPGYGLPLVEATGAQVRFTALAMGEAFTWQAFPDLIFVKARVKAVTMFTIGRDASGAMVRRLAGTMRVSDMMVRRATADDWPYP